jgi:hypothetical protein
MIILGIIKKLSLGSNFSIQNLDIHNLDIQNNFSIQNLDIHNDWFPKFRYS